MRAASASAPPVTVALIQSLLREDEAVVYHYWLRPTVLVVATITATEREVERRAVSAQQRALLERLDSLSRLQGSNLGMDELHRPARRRAVSREGAAVPARQATAAISPHRLLHWFPFHAAPWDGEPLVRRFAVRYVPNLLSLVLEPAPARDRHALALAVSRFEGRESTLGSLSSAPEADAIATAIASAPSRWSSCQSRRESACSPWWTTAP